MSVANFAAASWPGGTVRHQLPTRMARFAFYGLLAVAAGVGAGSTGSQATTHVLAQAGADWACLLRAMAALKALMAVGAAGAVAWRLASPASLAWLTAYSLAGTAMMAGPGLIWGLAHIGLGALLLHAGLVATLILLWCDPQVGTRLANLVAVRRATIARNNAGLPHGQG